MQDICNRCTVNSAILIVNDTQGLFAGWVACRVLWRPRNHLKGMVAVNFKNANNQQNHQSDCSSLPSLHLYYVCNLQWNFNIECICSKKKKKLEIQSMSCKVLFALWNFKSTSNSESGHFWILLTSDNFTRDGAAGGSLAGILLPAMEHMAMSRSKLQYVQVQVKVKLYILCQFALGTFQKLWHWKGSPSNSCY